MTAVYQSLSVGEKREVSMYGCTVAQMREAVEESITFRFAGGAMMAASIMSDCQEMLSVPNPDSMVTEDVRQALNRAKWILSTYVMQNRS
jgi:hypothetical protein